MNSFWKRRLPFIGILLVLGVVALFINRSRGRNSPPITAAGGEDFQMPLVIQTPLYLQTDARWKNESLGGSSVTIGNAGCTVCCLAMALESFDCHFTPKELNAALKAANGYTWRGLIRWAAVREISKDKVSATVLDHPTHEIIDAALKRGELVLVKILLNNGIYHWVLIVGKKSREYLVRDPLEEGAGPISLSQYESDILGVRIIAILPPKK